MMRFKQPRRGSTLVLVGILLVVFVGVGAVAADVGRFYVVTSELQTAADAAALAGGLALQKTTVLNPAAEVEDSVISFVSKSTLADGAAPTVVRDSIAMAYYNPGPPSTLTYDVSTRRPNAVVVPLSVAPRGLFSQLLGLGLPMNTTRRAAVWVANLSINCVRPWAFPYHVLYDAVNQSQATPSPLVGAPNLDPVKFASFVAAPPNTRMFVMTGPNNPTGGPVHDGNWEGYSFAGNAGIRGYQRAIEDCANKQVAVNVAGGTTLPGASGNNYVNWTTSAIEPNPPSYPGVCYLKPMGANDAGCYKDASSAAAGTPGVIINAAWGDMAGTGANAFNAREVGEFVLTCYFRGNAGESCPDQKAGSPQTGYSEGTMVGYVNGLASKSISPATILSNAPSNLQRLFLVR